MPFTINTVGNRIIVTNTGTVNDLTFTATVEASISDDLDATAVGAIVTALCGNAQREAIAKFRHHRVRGTKPGDHGAIKPRTQDRAETNSYAYSLRESIRSAALFNNTITLSKSELRVVYEQMIAPFVSLDKDTSNGGSGGIIGELRMRIPACLARAETTGYCFTGPRLATLNSMLGAWDQRATTP